jgi:hypothetical protein
MKIIPMGAELFHADGWTNGRTIERTILISAFRDFMKEPKNNNIY